MDRQTERAIVFVDGSNFYHGCRRLQLTSLGRLNFARLSEKLAGNRRWIATRYYVGQVAAVGNLALATRQQKYLASLRASDPRVSVHLGRIEPRLASSPAASRLGQFLARLPVRIDKTIYQELLAISKSFATASVMVEKAVDVKLAVDMVVMAERDQFDTAYLLSADGDLTPAVEAVRSTRRRVFVASAQSGAQLAAACDTFIPLRREWFNGLFDL